MSTLCEKLQAAASERDVGLRARPANGIPSSTSQLHSHATCTAVLAQCRSLVVGGCGSDAMSRRDLVINVKLMVTRGGDGIHAWPTQQNSWLGCVANSSPSGYSWVRSLVQGIQYFLSLCPSCSSIVLSRGDRGNCNIFHIHAHYVVHVFY